MDNLPRVSLDDGPAFDDDFDQDGPRPASFTGLTGLTGLSSLRITNFDDHDDVHVAQLAYVAKPTVQDDSAVDVSVQSDELPSVVIRDASPLLDSPQHTSDAPPTPRTVIHLNDPNSVIGLDETNAPTGVQAEPQSPSKRHRLSNAFKDKFRLRSSSTSSHKSGRSRSNSEVKSVHVSDSSQTTDWEARAIELASTERTLDSTVSTVSTSSSKPSQYRKPMLEAELQEAIALYESGNLADSSRILCKLADPNTTNNALAQVLYGLALRHGWGVERNPEEAIVYLRLAAARSAEIERDAAATGTELKRARGELTLAIFELANCFRYGWGVEIDAVAAKHYYEVAANMGDPDAMSETAWCLLEGFGCKKDKYMAAQFYRMAEKAGKQEVGQSWIWKDKYNEQTENRKLFRRK
ncbi:hypothetical protein V1512DRAFT_262624 [Lipomyces arxii]|uniref:uncharacterized protein n=1 Tax=Lipomyces arxii TaxID=56418 RepID=UPI0034CFFB12